MSGELELAGGKMPRGLVFDMPGGWTVTTAASGETVSHFSPHTVEVPMLRGRFRTNHNSVLLDAEVSYVFPEQARARAKMALCGWEIPNQDPLLFDSVEFQVSGLTELSGVTAFREMTLPTSDATDRHFSATWNSSADQAWQAATGEELSLGYVAHVNFDRSYRYSVSSYPVVTIKGEPRSAEEWMQGFVRPLAELTTLATATKQSISWVLLKPPGHDRHDVQVFAADIAQEPFDAQSPEPRSVGSLVRLGPGGASLADLLAGWRNLQDSYDIFFDYLTVSLREEMSFKTRFLALVPALESYHTTKYGDGPVSRADFRRQRKAVLGRLKAAEGVQADDIAWLDEWVSTLGSYPLQERLRQLLHDLPEALQDRIRSGTDPLPTCLEGTLERPQDVWHVMGKVRNNLAHGGGTPTWEQLACLTRLAHTMAVGLALQQLGVPDTALINAIDRGDWTIL